MGLASRSPYSRRSGRYSVVVDEGSGGVVIVCAIEL